MWKGVVPEQCEICPVETGHGQIRRLEEEAVYQACPGGQGRKKETSANAHEMRRCMRGCVHVCLHGCVHACLCGCVRACLHGCVRACLCGCVHACLCGCVHACLHLIFLT